MQDTDLIAIHGHLPIYRIFFGDRFNPINISSIRVISTATNYQKIIQSITALDAIISGLPITSVPSFAPSLIEHLLNDEMENEFNPFIYETFKIFLARKIDITLNMYQLSYYNIDTFFLRLIFGGNGFKQFKYDPISSLSDVRVSKYFIPSVTTNIPIICNQFCNLQTIKMEQTQCINKYYSLSLVSLLSLLESQSNIRQIKISTSNHGGTASDGTNWMSFAWKNDSVLLKQKYKRRGYNIDYNKGNVFTKDTISIEKQL